MLRMQEMTFQKFSGGVLPQTPPIHVWYIGHTRGLQPLLSPSNILSHRKVPFQKMPPHGKILKKGPAYTSLVDERFSWLENEFLSYFKAWKKSTTDRVGNFTPNVRSKMFISWQTYEGLQITTLASIEVTKFLLTEGLDFVLTERFCQDPVEEYFGNQRKLGRRSDNPDMFSFGYNTNTLRIQREVSLTSGNMRGRKDKRKSWENVSEDAVPKRKVLRTKNTK